MLLSQARIANPLRPKLTCARKHGHQQAPHVFAAIAAMVDLWKYLDRQLLGLDLPGKSGEHQLRNQEVFYGKREQTDAGVSA